MDNLKFSTYKFSQALEFWVEIVNFSKTTSANILFPAKPGFFFYSKQMGMLLGFSWLNLALCNLLHFKTMETKVKEDY